MKAGILASVIGVAVAAAAGIYVFADQLAPTASDVLLDACDEVLKARLKSPTSYVRMSNTDLGIGPATLDDYMGVMTEQERRLNDMIAAQDPAYKKAQESQRELYQARPPLKHAMLIVYDAANSYGTPIRGSAECSAILVEGADAATAKYLDARIDGYSALDWSVYQLRIARGQLVE